jgi:hypothetical protein
MRQLGRLRLAHDRLDGTGPPEVVPEHPFLGESELGRANVSEIIAQGVTAVGGPDRLRKIGASSSSSTPRVVVF